MKKYQVEVEVTKTYKALVEVEITEDIDGDDFQRVVEEEVESMDQSRKKKLDYKETNHLVLKINDIK
jgi:transposase